MDSMKADLLPAITESREPGTTGDTTAGPSCSTPTTDQGQGRILVNPNYLDTVISKSVERAVSARVERIQRETMRHATAVVHLSQASTRRRNPFRWVRPAPLRSRQARQTRYHYVPPAGSAPPPPLMGINSAGMNSQPPNPAATPSCHHHAPYPSGHQPACYEQHHYQPPHSFMHQSHSCCQHPSCNPTHQHQHQYSYQFPPAHPPQYPTTYPHSSYPHQFQ